MSEAIDRSARSVTWSRLARHTVLGVTVRIVAGPAAIAFNELVALVTRILLSGVALYVPPEVHGHGGPVRAPARGGGDFGPRRGRQRGGLTR